MSNDTRWDDARYVAQQKAYGDGEYDGYWGSSPRGGIYTALERVLYLRGYLAGVKERAQEPSDAQIEAWMRTIGANDDFETRLADAIDFETMLRPETVTDDDRGQR